MPTLNPQILRFLSKKKQDQLLVNVLLMDPHIGVWILSFLDTLLSCIVLALVFTYEPNSDDESLNDDSPWLSSYSKYLAQHESFFVFSRTSMVLTTSIMLVGFEVNLRSLMLPYIASSALGVVGSLAHLFYDNKSMFLTTLTILILTTELSSCITVSK
jgi:hypothetical protein